MPLFDFLIRKQNKNIKNSQTGTDIDHDEIKEKTAEKEMPVSHREIEPVINEEEIYESTNNNEVLSIASGANNEISQASKASPDRFLNYQIPFPYEKFLDLNVKDDYVSMLEMMNKFPSPIKDDEIIFPVGKDKNGNSVYCDITKLPHLLIGGTTGSGKTTLLHVIINSILLSKKPEEAKLLLFDPKKVEFGFYKQIPHLFGPVISDINESVNSLKVISKIVDDRLDLFKKLEVRNIKEYNGKVITINNDLSSISQSEKLPYIVVIIDHFSELMSISRDDTEITLMRIFEFARTTGVHFIVSTQRASSDIISAIIKSNIPSRISFALPSAYDSKTILDQPGAEKLRGPGNMLYYPFESQSLQKIKGTYISDNEISKITNYVSSQAVPMYDDAFILLEGINNGTGVGGISDVESDPLFQEVKKYVIDSQKASTSLLQRRFGISYNRAARMIDELERGGIIGPAKGSNPREVYR